MRQMQGYSISHLPICPPQTSQFSSPAQTKGSVTKPLVNCPSTHLFLSGRNPERVKQASESILKEDGCKAVLDSVIIDVGDDDSIKAAVKEVEAKLGDAALDVLVVGSSLACMIQ
jgi:NADP-dependent 3-hydroxy acid dehydrogenase YdfG